MMLLLWFGFLAWCGVARGLQAAGDKDWLVDSLIWPWTLGYLLAHWLYRQEGESES